MVKKSILYLITFNIFFLINLIIIKKGLQKYYKQQRIKEIFSSINSATNDLFSSSTGPQVLAGVEAKFSIGDGRVANLKNFFRRYNSPLYDYAELIVEVSDKYHFDYRLLPAIAMQESNLCKYIPKDSHNCWGWGIYGDKVIKFNSYEEAIKTVAKGIKEHYLDKGLITASKIMEKYTPSSNGSWANGVNTFLRLLE